MTRSEKKKGDKFWIDVFFKGPGLGLGPGPSTKSSMASGWVGVGGWIK